MTRRIFAPPWVVDDTSIESFCIRDAKGHALRYVNYEDETGGLTWPAIAPPTGAPGGTNVAITVPAPITAIRAGRFRRGRRRAKRDSGCVEGPIQSLCWSRISIHRTTPTPCPIAR